MHPASPHSRRWQYRWLHEDPAEYEALSRARLWMKPGLLDDEPLSPEEIAADLRQFGKDGGFRELKKTPCLRHLLALRCVDQRSREEGGSRVLALQAILKDIIDNDIDLGIGNALTPFLQIKTSGWGRDLGARRDRAGGHMQSVGHPRGVSARTWERRYELHACLHVARLVVALEKDALREMSPPVPSLLSRSRPPILAIAPFHYVTAPTLDKYVVQGLVDDVASRLARLSTLIVISPSSAESWAFDPDPLRRAHEESSADIVLTGTLQHAADGLRVTLRLDDTTTSQIRWSTSLLFSVGRLMEAQAGIADAVVSALDIDLSRPETNALRRPRTHDAAAYEFYLRAVGLLAQNSEAETRVALGLLHQAVALDGDFAAAWAYKGYALWRQYFSGWAGGANLLTQALDCANSALDRDGSSVAARITRIRVGWDLGLHEDALIDGEAALEAQPHNPHALLAIARALNNCGLADLALHISRSLLSVDPADITVRKLLIWNLVMVKQYHQALTEGEAHLALHAGDANTSWAVAASALGAGKPELGAKIALRGLEADGTDASLWLLAGYAYRHAGDETAALTTWSRGVDAVRARSSASPDNHRLLSWLAGLYACVGDVSAARTTIRQSLSAEPTNAYLAYRVAGAFAEAGDISSALQQIRKAIDHGFRSVQLLEFDQRLSFSTLGGSILFQQYIKDLNGRVDEIRTRYRPLVERLTIEGGSDDGRE